jgi:hypothetical protein
VRESVQPKICMARLLYPDGQGGMSLWGFRY